MSDNVKPSFIEIARYKITNFFWEKIVPLSIILGLVYSCSGDPSIDVDRGFSEKLGKGHWTVDNISIGDSYSDVVELVRSAKAREIDSSPFASAYKFNYGATAVYFDAENIVQRVVGSGFYRGDELIAEARGHTAGRVEIKLGKGHVTKYYDVRSNHIFDEKRTLNSKEYLYHDGKNQRFKLYFYGRESTLGEVEVVALEEL